MFVAFELTITTPKRDGNLRPRLHEGKVVISKGFSEIWVLSSKDAIVVSAVLANTLCAGPDGQLTLAALASSR